jgi:hypothetical protein
MGTQESEVRPAGKRGQVGTKAKGGHVRSGTRAEKPEHGPEDVTGINPDAMRPIDPRMPYIPPP